MKIVILAGGTGSIALQKGLFDLIERSVDGIDVKVLVNGYDDGLSTGLVRRVVGGTILGPSDIRKNQTTRLQLQVDSKIADPWLNFLNIRFTSPSSEAKQYCLDEVANLRRSLTEALGHSSPKDSMYQIDEDRVDKLQLIREAIETYFRFPLSTKIDYNDFSLANIIYAGFASANGNSMRMAAKIMAGILGIDDCVIINDDKSLFLGAVTKSGMRIMDEGDIVSWGNAEDPIVDVFFSNTEGEDSCPVLNAESKTALEEADLVILSAGTQWSSLIPTYVSTGFKESIEKSKAEIVMIMNRIPDQDSPGQSASDIVNILTDRFFPKNRIRVLIDPTAHPLMQSLDEEATSRVKSVDSVPMQGAGSKNTKVHNPFALAVAVGRAYFREVIDADYYVFDYDDTLVGRGNVFPLASSTNIRNIRTLNAMTQVAICTGNSIKAINLKNFSSVMKDGDGNLSQVPDEVIVYADGGVNKYRYISPCVGFGNPDEMRQQLVECVNPSATLTPLQVDGIIRTLRFHHIPVSKIENRGNVMIAIKPIDSEYRNMILELVKMVIDQPGISVKAAGRTTIEIMRDNVSKLDAIIDIKKCHNPNRITYVGDEIEHGNDSVVKNMPGVNCLNVKNPSQTAFFTQVLLVSLDKGQNAYV